MTARFRHAGLLFVGLVLVGAGVALMRGQIDRARAQGEAGCPGTGLSGRYAYHLSGVVFLGPSGVPQPSGVGSDFAAVGVLTLDGRGGFTAVDTAAMGSQRVRRTFQGDYNVQPDCTGTVRIRGNEVTVDEINLVVAARGTEIVLLSVTSTGSFTGKATKQ